MTTETTIAAHRHSSNAMIPYPISEQLGAYFDPALGAMWLRWRPQPRPCFNAPLLDACKAYADFMQQTCGLIEHEGERYPIKSSIIASDVPGVFNLGGDLNLFAKLIDTHDEAGLMDYGMACIDAVYNNYMSYGLPLTTISLVQGECLGGGFEAALSSNLVIAERSARFGFPEIIFNLFPGMGAVSFVIRRTNSRTAEALTNTGTIFSAEEMLEKGVIDMVVNDGDGVAAVEEYLRKKEPLMRSIFQVRKRVQRKLIRSELDEIVGFWVNAALQINPRDLRLMGLLVARQDRLH